MEGRLIIHFMFYFKAGFLFYSNKIIYFLNPSALVFVLLLKTILRHPYLKILDLANLFVADAPMNKKIKKIVLPPLRAL